MKTSQKNMQKKILIFGIFLFLNTHIIGQTSCGVEGTFSIMYASATFKENNSSELNYKPIDRKGFVIINKEYVIFMTEDSKGNKYDHLYKPISFCIFDEKAGLFQYYAIDEEQNPITVQIRKDSLRSITMLLYDQNKDRWYGYRLDD